MASKTPIKTAINQTEPENQPEASSDWETVGSAVADSEGETVACGVAEAVGSADGGKDDNGEIAAVAAGVGVELSVGTVVAVDCAALGTTCRLIEGEKPRFPQESLA